MDGGSQPAVCASFEEVDLHVLQYQAVGAPLPVAPGWLDLSCDCAVFLVAREP